jgi:septum formation protein
MKLSGLSGNIIILASSSPRRRQLLSYIISDFEVIPSGIEEEASGTPRQIVIKLAKDKAQDVERSRPDALVIGADTIVVLGGKVLGKPKDKSDAAVMLSMLSGKSHKVYTGVAVIYQGKVISRCCVTEVTFDDMTREEISDYIETGEPMDKAGAYGIQGYGSKFITKVSGDYFNVMGLPVNTLYKMLKRSLY